MNAEENEVSSIGSSFANINHFERLFYEPRICFDIIVMAVNIVLDWCYIASFSEYMLTFNLSS